MAMILITHDLGLVAGIADRILVMYAGRVVEEGPTDQIFYDPQHPYTLGLLGAVPSLADDDSAAPHHRRHSAGADRPAERLRLRHPLPVPDAHLPGRAPPYFEPIPGNRSACWLHDDQAAAQRAAFIAARRA